MWGALRSDLKEFASSIATDSTSVLETIDTKLNNENTTNAEYNSLLTSDPDGSACMDVSEGIALDLNNGKNDPNGNEAGDDEDDDEGTADNTFIMESMMADVQEEIMRRIEMDETFVTPLLRSDVNGVKVNKVQAAPAGKDDEEDIPAEKTTADDDEENEGEVEAGTGVADSEKEKDENIGNETQPLTHPEKETEEDAKFSPVPDREEDEEPEEDEEEIKQYLAEFDIQSKTEQISTLLSDYPHLADNFETLVPVVVTYEQFWQRYFYRCDPQRIIKEWQDEDERARLKRQELIGKGVKSVQNMFGGALQAFKKVTVQDGGKKEESIYEKYQAELEEKQKAMLPTSTEDNQNDKGGIGKRLGALGFFGGTGRPPFVMNTAESDNEEDIYEEDDEEEYEEEEEELSWGSDDDEEEEEEDDDDESSDENGVDKSEQEIVFTSPEAKSTEVEKLREELSDAQQDRDQLNETIKKQAVELAKYKDTASSASNTGTGTDVGDAERERLQMQIFEKDSELAALKASLDDTHENDSAIDKRMEIKIQEKDKEIEKLNLEVKQLRIDVTTAENLTEERLSFLQSKFDQEKAEYEDSLAQLTHQMSITEEAASSKIVAMNQKHSSVDSTIADLKTQLQAAQSKQEQAEAMVQKLQTELESSAEEMKTQSLNFAKTLEDEISKARSEQNIVSVAPLISTTAQEVEGSSMSSAVDISSKVEKSTNEDDGWGNSWSSDDDDE